MDWEQKHTFKLKKYKSWPNHHVFKCRYCSKRLWVGKTDFRRLITGEIAILEEIRPSIFRIKEYEEPMNDGDGWG